MTNLMLSWQQATLMALACGVARVVLEHAGLPTEESRIAHREGWEGCLSNLRGRVFGD